jgi:uncharacterized protein YqjF (DUF2071 family)
MQHGLKPGISSEERLAARRRPRGRPIGYQRWRNLLFLHWRLPVHVIRPLLPGELEVDTWEGDAWLGLVAFHMTGVRPWWCPPVPGVSTFHETNLRTYVHYRGRRPGVWFFSLEAARSLAVRIARWRWKLPYFRARMRVVREGQRVEYTSQRLWPEPADAITDLCAELGEPHTAPPDSLEFFLAERYLLYTASSQGGLLVGQVQHVPYPLQAARVLRCQETLSRAADISCEQPPCHAMFSDGVDVEIFPLLPLTKT